jgi:hydrogenase expression/formation protein HypC
MCLAIPGQIVERVEGYGGQLVLVDVVGVQRQINLGMLTDAEQAGLGVGDWVLIHMGFALERIDQEGAERALAGLELMGRARAADPADGEQRPAIT